jgi:hypothetical protein
MFDWRSRKVSIAQCIHGKGVTRRRVLSGEVARHGEA